MFFTQVHENYFYLASAENGVCRSFSLFDVLIGGGYTPRPLPIFHCFVQVEKVIDLNSDYLFMKAISKHLLEFACCTVGAKVRE